jgi:hypothetical protein
VVLTNRPVLNVEVGNIVLVGKIGSLDCRVSDMDLFGCVLRIPVKANTDSDGNVNSTLRAECEQLEAYRRWHLDLQEVFGFVKKNYPQRSVGTRHWRERGAGKAREPFSLPVLERPR